MKSTEQNVTRAQKNAIADCARRCEAALVRADAAETISHDTRRAGEWRERAAWWSDEAFRRVAA